MIKTALIMAAGLGTRFGKMTETMPKGFVEVGGKSMIERSVETLIACGIEKIIIGTGYRKEKYEDLQKKYPQIETCFSPKYAETNSMYTLWNTRNQIGNDGFLLLESDLIFEEKAIRALLESPWEDIMLISSVTKFQDQYYVESDADNILTACSVIKEEIEAKGELVGIHKLSDSFYRKMCVEYEKIVDDKPKLGYEYMLLSMSKEVSPVYVLKIDRLQWYEIDDEQDLKYAEENIINNI
ncbi:phosphocholine cytidylyltransferase family protein [Bacteroides fluxus]|uniref:phosphocholine cytidylyltransferase family protein n=2 Tax=Bacteroides fluxus TaxID=626930 RepID=UPI0023A83732|nr:phosphocholine cytidylyltransferase family protein [Bacteroides fluxus]